MFSTKLIVLVTIFSRIRTQLFFNLIKTILTLINNGNDNKHLIDKLTNQNTKPINQHIDECPS